MKGNLTLNPGKIEVGDLLTHGRVQAGFGWCCTLF